MSEPLIDLAVEEEGWLDDLPDLEAHAEAAARLALEAAGLDSKGWEISLLACSDSRIAELNRAFRGKPAPTNVLSWPAFDLAPDRPGAPPPPPRRSPDIPSQSLGDVAIALQTTRAEARERAIPLKDHAIHLILHGCLHLLGFDHETEADAELMEGIETRALARIGVADPYLRSDAGQPRPD
ncbi:MAG TPA: rRNA maturation RNase YbeY [Thermohalobaculum sp.]|nr:rRNA maturation RNase YbeY [Thermohalobaculum sp.]